MLLPFLSRVFYILPLFFIPHKSFTASPAIISPATDGTIGKIFFYMRYNSAHYTVRKESAFSALQHKRSETESVPYFAARNYFILRKAVSLSIFVIPADTAVKAVVFAVIRKFHKPAEIHFIAVNFFSDGVRSGKKFYVIAPKKQQRAEIIITQCLVFLSSSVRAV